MGAAEHRDLVCCAWLFAPEANREPDPGEVQADVAHGDDAVIAVAEQNTFRWLGAIAAEGYERREGYALAQGGAIATQFAAVEIYLPQELDMVQFDEMQFPAIGQRFEVVCLFGGHGGVQVAMYVMACGIRSELTQCLHVFAWRDGGKIDITSDAGAAGCGAACSCAC